MKEFSYVSVCSGIEAASVAWHPLGWTPVLFSEIADFPRRVLAERWPGIPLVGDFTELVDHPPKAELLVGGTPCQAFSIAGKRLSLEDLRGNLTLAFAELYHSGNYDWALWENVPGVLSTKDNAFGSFLARMVGANEPCVTPSGKWSPAGIVAGPQATAAWRVLDAQYFGVAQRRKRVFVLVSRGAGNARSARALFPQLEGVCGIVKPSREATQTSADSFRSGTADRDLFVSIDKRTAQVSYEVTATLKTDLSHQMGPIVYAAPIGPTMGAGPPCSRTGNASEFEAIVVQGFGVGRPRRITPREGERLQGFPEDYTLLPGCTDPQRYMALGNSMAVPAMRWLGERIELYSQRK